MLRPRALAVAFLLSLCGAGATARPAAAVFPGANGRLFVYFRLYDPPAASTNPVLSFPLANPRFSPDAEHVTGTMGTGASSAVYMADADGSNVRQLSTPPSRGGGDQTPTWSADGKEVIFERLPPIACGGGQTCDGSQLMTVDVETGQTRAITGAGLYPVYLHPDADPAPDAHRVVAVVFPDDSSPPEVDLIDTGTGARQKVLGQSDPYPAIVSARFAPDSKTVVVGLGAPRIRPARTRFSWCRWRKAVRA